MLTLTLISLLAANPKASEGVRVAFVNGDLTQAQKMAMMCSKSEPKICKQYVKWLAEYSFLYTHYDSLKPDDVRAFIDFDLKMSPKQRGRLTDHVIERYVNKPFETAKSLANGNQKRALEIVDIVLSIDPKHAEALALKKQLLSELDGGTR